MGSLSGLFDLSRGALQANQAALNATANNVANQNTEGYTRQVTSFASGDVVTLSGVGGGPSAQANTAPGVSTTSVRDRILEQRLQQQMQVQSQTGARSDVLTQIQTVFSLTGSGTPGSTQLGSALDSFFSSLTAMAGAPGDAATRQGVLSAATALTSAFHSAANQLAAVGNTVAQQIPDSVTAVNALTKSIAQLNGEITGLAPHSDAGALEDQRQLAIEQLSKYVGLDQIRTENNGIAVSTQGGAVLVEGQTSVTLQATTAGGVTRILDATGADVTAGVQGGSIGGQLTAQHVDLPAVSAALDALAYRIGSAVNAQNAAGVTPSGAAGGAIFALPATATGAAATIAVIPTSASAIASAAVGEGATGNTNANALAALATATDSSGVTVSGGLGVMLAQVGSGAAAMLEQNTTDQATLTQLKTARDSTSAVSLDTEAANLSQYQRAYQAAAKVLQVVDQLLGSAINLGTATPVS
jgi:flagellar hook-associated protein 1 FlgK